MEIFFVEKEGETKVKAQKMMFSIQICSLKYSKIQPYWWISSKYCSGTRTISRFLKYVV